ncbi:ATP-grasp fold amidoligase family protein [Kushneria sp. TE3]|uniref:ATP-grasp fold amidoligase family protein n=1 Tax=Kushneria sp. TE3 TaxID=3449832 RepID=UPI003F68500F
MACLSDRHFTMLRHWRAFGVLPDLSNPTTFSEKIGYRKLHPTPSMSVLSDKIAVRDYVRERIGEQYLIPCYATADELTPELLKTLPERFVMKGNHGSGYNLLVEDKSQWTFPELYDISQNWLNDDFSRVNRETQYRAIKPRLLFEQRLGSDPVIPPSDYKFHCFRRNGKLTVIVQIMVGRFQAGGHQRVCLTPDWQPVRVETREIEDVSTVEKPAGFDRALALSEQLSEGFDYVRVDFYILDDEIYFGELTFTPGGGFMELIDRQVDHYLGSLFTIDREMARARQVPL